MGSEAEVSVRVIGTNVRKVYREVCGECRAMLEYGLEDIQHKGCSCGDPECGFVMCPGCKHEILHDRHNPAMTIYDQVGK